MKTLSNDQKEQIMIYLYENGYLLMREYFDGVNITLEALGYKDRVRFDVKKGIFKWSNINDH